MYIKVKKGFKKGKWRAETGKLWVFGFTRSGVDMFLKSHTGSSEAQPGLKNTDLGHGFGFTEELAIISTEK